MLRAWTHRAPLARGSTITRIPDLDARDQTGIAPGACAWHALNRRAGFSLPLTAAHAQSFFQATTVPPFLTSLAPDMDPKVGHKRSFSVANAASSASAAATPVEGAGEAAFVSADAAEQSRLQSDLDQLTRELEIIRGELEDMRAALFATPPRDTTSAQFIFYGILAAHDRVQLFGAITKKEEAIMKKEEAIMKKEEALMKKNDEIRALRIATSQKETVTCTEFVDANRGRFPLDCPSSHNRNRVGRKGFDCEVAQVARNTCWTTPRIRSKGQWVSFFARHPVSVRHSRR